MNPQSILSQVKKTFSQLDCTGGGVIIKKHGQTILEEYFGVQGQQKDAKKVGPHTLFHLASVRKAYVGFAVAYAIYHNYIASIDDELSDYLDDEKVFADVSIRHLLTHTHGLRRQHGIVMKEFKAGYNWAYRDINVELLAKVILKVTGKTIAQIVDEQVLQKLSFTDTDWFSEKNEQHIEVKHNNSPFWYESDICDGSKMNMYSSLSELAKWGQVHLDKGRINGKQIIPEEIIQLVTTIQSPNTKPKNLPTNGFFWFVQPHQKEGITELSPILPQGSFQLLGYTSVAILVIPDENIVAVRGFNSFGSPEGFDYMKDIHDFGSTVYQSIL
ncbi:serine hydrolase domain-containing protein [Lysinibacillus sp. Bpr_S20]|uniref:serine hydrolase domain-containing protein n=1 Tax=Lysinibacillus sp. Bpr_S20 TaxID=2933964 RepID=UPI002012246E|nr:serine hydrolase domain-containing protein [Lysinibacillus sp. Bpr_S20]MCL1702751.1 beta-lactamase family protein [Lysinibacillus sp. Bpr_S20]